MFRREPETVCLPRAEPLAARDLVVIIPGERATLPAASLCARRFILCPGAQRYCGILSYNHRPAGIAQSARNQVRHEVSVLRISRVARDRLA